MILSRRLRNERRAEGKKKKIPVKQRGHQTKKNVNGPLYINSINSINCIIGRPNVHSSDRWPFNDYCISLCPFFFLS